MNNLISLLKYCTGMLTLLMMSMSTFSALATNITVENGFIRATIPGTTISSAYMDIYNRTQVDAVLKRVTSDVSDRIEIHEHVMAEGMMKMRQRESLTIPSNEHVSLQPSGYHLMIFDLHKPLIEQMDVTLTLHFEGNKKVDVMLPVQSIKRKKKQASTHYHHH